jgi:hypothetical protein
MKGFDISQKMDQLLFNNQVVTTIGDLDLDIGLEVDGTIQATTTVTILQRASLSQNDMVWLGTHCCLGIIIHWKGSSSNVLLFPLYLGFLVAGGLPSRFSFCLPSSLLPTNPPCHPHICVLDTTTKRKNKTRQRVSLQLVLTGCDKRGAAPFSTYLQAKCCARPMLSHG